MSDPTKDADRLAGQRGKRSKWLRPVLGLALGCVLVALLLVIGEVAVRVFCPFVNFQGVQKGLLVSDPEVGGLVSQPGATGVCFGTQVAIDEDGCRVIGTAEAPEWSWLFIGDSVAFGPGVPSEETFAGLLQHQYPHIRIRNAAVCATGFKQYPGQTRRMLRADSAIRRISLWVCLNDVGELQWDRATAQEQDAGQLKPRKKRTEFVQRIVEFLRPRSKLYLLLKGLATDPSKKYCSWDIRQYKYLDPENDEILDNLGQIATMAADAGAQFEVILLPAEYQLRLDTDDVWLPQQKLAQYLSNQGIAFRDARHWFQSDGQQQGVYYLFGDGYHFSSEGHRVVFENLVGDVDIDTSPQ